MVESTSDLAGLTDVELAAIATATINQLAGRATPDSFKLLIELSSHVGIALGESARQYALQESWSQVAAISGTTKQAAWSRWR